MKKNFFVVGMAVMLLTFAVVFVGCSSSAPFVYDTTVPPEQSSTLIIRECQVYKFNGTTMSVKNWSAGVGEKTVIIPAGTHTLEVWSSESSGGGTKLEYGKVEMTHTFLAGRTYLLTAPIEGGSIKGSITNMPTLTNAVVPNPESPDATPFEGVWVNTDQKQEWVFANNEFLVKQNGADIYRGMFTYKENIVAARVYYMYAFGKWITSRVSPRYDLTYDGTTLKIGDTILKKAE